MADTKGTYYTPDELFEIFKEQHRLFSPLDPEADSTIELSPESSIVDWANAMDLAHWRLLALYFNSSFSVAIPMEAWQSVFRPPHMHTMREVCVLLSQHAVKEEIPPVRLFGQDCQSAAIFLWLKAKLGNAGIDVSPLRPSTPISEYKKHFHLLMDEVLRRGVHTIDKIELEKFPAGEAWKYIFDFFLPDRVFGRRLLTGDVVTFRDLVERIVEARPLGTVRTDSATE